ncbi:hypothetical protein NDA13_001543 [Ustilago tritici]|nr:hypothetical protein NDA13_001543 [Ustilago tritici]
MINNKEIWFSFLHISAMMGKGMINSDTIEHTNLWKQYTADDAGSRGSFSGHAADAGHAASVSDAPVQPRAPSPTQSPALPLPHLLPASRNSLHSLSESGCLDPALAEEDGVQQDDSDNQFVPQAVIENAEGYWQQVDDDDDKSIFQEAEDANGDEDVLDPQEEQIINISKPAPPGFTPLALEMLKGKLYNILRHLAIANIIPRPGLSHDILKFSRYTARRRGLYPTGKLKKVWISDDTVAAVRAGVWNSFTHDISPAGARSVQNLLSLQLIIVSGCVPETRNLPDQSFSASFNELA